MQNPNVRLASALILSVLIGGFAVPVSGEDLSQEFKARFPDAVAKLREQYSHVRMEGILTVSDATDQVLQVDNIECIREGGLVRQTSTAVKSTRKNWMPGSTSVSGGSIDKYFVMVRKAGKPEFQSTLSGPNPKLEKALIQLPPLTRPFATREFDVGEFFARKDVVVVSAENSPDDGPDAVAVTASEPFPAGQITARFVFMRPSWALLRWSYRLSPKGDGVVSEGQIAYQPQVEPPVMKSCEESLKDPGKPGGGGQTRLVEIKSLAFEHTPVDKFTPEVAMADAPPPTSKEGTGAMTLPSGAAGGIR